MEIFYFICNGSFINHIEGEKTSINGSVYSRENQQTWSLENSTLVLIIKHDMNHTDIHHIKLNVNQSTFPIHFRINNLHQIKSEDDYLLTLLIFGYPHRLLWESSLPRPKNTVCVRPYWSRISL